MNIMQELLIDSMQKKKAFQGLAHTYAREGNSWMAIHSQFISDLFAVEHLLLEQGASTDDFRGVILSAITSNVIDVENARVAVENYRKILRGSLPEEIAQQWETGIAKLDYLNTIIGMVDSAPARIAKAGRVGEMSVQDYALGRRREQGEYLANANAMYEAGDMWEAINNMYNADLSGFEAWLVQRSIVLGDEDLVFCDLLWALAVAALEQLTSLPEDPAQAVFIVRSRLAWVVGPREAKDLSLSLANPSFIQ